MDYMKHHTEDEMETKDETWNCPRCDRTRPIGEIDATGICFECEDFKDEMRTES